MWQITIIKMLNHLVKSVNGDKNNEINDILEEIIARE